jgi:hypothetical protein
MGFLDQSQISEKNLVRLAELSRHEDLEVRSRALLVAEIARAKPGKRRRWLQLAQVNPALFGRAVEQFGIDFFEDLLIGYGDFDSPLCEVLRTLEAGEARLAESAQES